MGMMWTSLRLAVAAASMVGGVSLASANVLYDNGPNSGSPGGVDVAFQAVEKSFTLSSAATVNGIIFDLWTSFNPDTWQSGTVYEIDWGISPIEGSFADDGTVPVAMGSGFSVSGEAIHEFSASIGPVELTAGTYYLTLQNAVASSFALWDENNGPSTAATSTNGALASSETFQVTGQVTETTVPEASTWAMMALGFTGLGLAGYRASRRHASVAA